MKCSSRIGRSCSLSLPSATFHRREAGLLGHVGHGGGCSRRPRWTRLSLVMQVTNIHEAKTHFSKLIDRVGEGEEIIIAKAGKPVARLVGYKEAAPPKRKPGSMKGKIKI